MQTLPFPVLRLIYCLLPGLLLAPNVSNAQNTVPNPVIDSLKQVIATTEVDSVKSRTLCRLCQLQRRSGEYEEALVSVQKGLAIVQQAKDPLGEGECYIKMSGYFMSQSNYTEALGYI